MHENNKGIILQIKHLYVCKLIFFHPETPDLDFRYLVYLCAHPATDIQISPEYQKRGCFEDTYLECIVLISHILLNRHQGQT